MAASTHCTACLRLVRQQSCQIQRLSQVSDRCLSSQRTLRYFTSTLRPSAAQVAASNTSTSTHPITTTKSDPLSKTVSSRPDTTSPTLKLAKKVRQHAAGVTESYVAYGVSEKLVKECARQADYSIPQAYEKGVEIPKTESGEDLGVGTGWWYEELGLTPTFNTWAQITFLHMYLLTVRIRCFPPAHAPAWHQQMIDHFSYAAEDRMATMHNVHARMIRNKYLKDLFIQWRGLTAAYDEGLVKGDAVLAAAVWRNVFKGDEEVDLRKLGQVVSYMRAVLHRLDKLEDEAVTSGDVVFGDPGSEAAGVKIRSKMMDKPITEEDLKPQEAQAQAA